MYLHVRITMGNLKNDKTVKQYYLFSAVRSTSCIFKFSPLGRRASYLHRRCFFLRGAISAIEHISAIPLFSCRTNPTEKKAAYAGTGVNLINSKPPLV